MRTMIAVVSAVLLAACATSRAPSATAQATSDLPSVGANFQTFKDAFNAEKDRVRVVALLSPT